MRDKDLGYLFKLSSLLILAGLLSCFARCPSFAQGNIAIFSKLVVSEGDASADGEKDYPSLENIVRGLRSFQGLDNKKSFTIFVPNNEAFKKLPRNTIDYFSQPENKKAMDELISFHVLEGKYSEGDLESLARKGGGTAYIKTLSGFKIAVKLRNGKDLYLENEAGKVINITAYNYSKGNGLVHVVDSAIIPYDHGLGDEDMAQFDAK